MKLKYKVMPGYLGTSVTSSFFSRPASGGFNFSILSSSPYVRENHLNVQERFYDEMEALGRKPQKITGRFKFVAGVIQKELEGILTNSDDFERLKQEGGGFSEAHIDRIFWGAPRQDDRDPENPLGDPWIANAEGLAEEADIIINWVRQNAEGPLSVI